ncbi:MAG: chemotaxis protein [Spirochaetia bacterium]|nr:chemotaxis protein [Spirochaetia bacterium]
MHTPEHILDVFLQPGDFFWGDRSTRIRTILGSCVSFCLWHPQLKEGGMCHFMLPNRGTHTEHNPNILNGKYGEEAWQLFEKEFKKNNTRASEYVVKIFGGSSMFAHEAEDKEVQNSKINIGIKNIELSRKLVQNNHLNVVSENLGGKHSRRLHYEIWSGNVWLKRQEVGN